MEHVWKVGDEFVVVSGFDQGDHQFEHETVVRIVELCEDGVHVYENQSGIEQWLTKDQVQPISQEFGESLSGEKKHSHYFKKCPYDYVDVYRVLEMFNVTDPCIAHATKKLLCAGARGVKDTAKDIQEAIDTLVRYQEMREEEKDNV